MRRRDGTRILPFISLLLFISFPNSAWATSDLASIEGFVRDSSGALLPGVLIKAINQATGSVVSSRSDSRGFFRFLSLRVGVYDLTADRKGFARLFERDVAITVGAHATLSLVLAPGSQAEWVVVKARGSPLETSMSQVSNTIGARSISGLPVNGRNYLNFVLLAPGVTPGSRGTFDISFAGQRKLNLVTVDGSDNADTFFGEVLGVAGSGTAPYQFSLAAVREIQVNINDYSAEYGRAAAGLVNVVTKSGTNQTHGEGFWFYRDKSLNATDLIDRLNGLPKSPYHFNQFGGSFGGPLKRDKSFYFVNFDGQRSTAQNPTSLKLPSGFSISPDPVTASFQERALDYLSARAYPWLRTFNQNVYLARFDTSLSPHHLLTVRWNGQRFFGERLEKHGPQISDEHTGASQSNTDTLTVQLSSTLSSSAANVANLSFIHSDQAGRAGSINPEARIFENGQLVLAVGRNPMSPRDTAIDGWQLSDTLSLIAGRHAVKVGADLLIHRIKFFTALNSSGSYRFGSLESFGRSLAGKPLQAPGDEYFQAFSGTGSQGTVTHPDFDEFAGFIQDDWHLHPHLTLNLGARYDLQVMAKPRVKNPSSALVAHGLDTSFVPKDGNNFAPRVGIAWTPFRSQALVFRGGYGVFYWYTPAIMTSRTFFQNGITVQTVDLEGGTSGGLYIPLYPNTMCGPPDPSLIAPDCAAPSQLVVKPILMLFSPTYSQPYTQHGHVGIGYQIFGNAVLNLEYLWVRGVHLQRVRDVNLGLPTSTETIGVAGSQVRLAYRKFTLPRPFVGFDRISLFESSASSIYNALAVNFRKTYSRHFMVSASYTWSKVIDDSPEPVAVNPGSATDSLLLSDPSNARADRSAGVDDQRHRLVIDGIWDMEFYRGRRSVLRNIFSDWEIGGILTAQTGHPYSGMVNSDLNNDGNSSNNRTPGLGRNTFYLPSTISLDPRVTRNIHLSERVTLQLIWEAFNVLNRSNITGVNTTQFAVSNLPLVCGIAQPPCLVPQVSGATAFGRPTATSGPRIMQLSARLIF